MNLSNILYLISHQGIKREIMTKRFVKNLTLFLIINLISTIAFAQKKNISRNNLTAYTFCKCVLDHTNIQNKDSIFEGATNTYFQNGNHSQKAYYSIDSFVKINYPKLLHSMGYDMTVTNCYNLVHSKKFKTYLIKLDKYIE
jgi:hypothetical protein